ncbi:MAG: carboxypeptidase regulatory-like domain-containing protein [Bryobacteraceae bacterium]
MRPFLLALLWASPIAFAQNQTQPDADKKTIRLEGHVLSVTGESVRKATVRLQGNSAVQGGQLRPSAYTESTDTAGKFVFEDVAEGNYTLSAEKAGFVTQRYGARSTGSSGAVLNLVPGVALRDLDIKMTPQGVISGKVTDLDGDPVNGGRVTVMRFAYPRGRKQLQQTAGATIDDQGEFRVADLAPGRYYLSVTDNRAPANGPDKEGQDSNVTTYYPNVIEPASAAPLDVTAGVELSGIDIRMRRAKVYSIRGKAVDPVTGAAPANAVLTLRKSSTDDSPIVAALTNIRQLRPDGGFEFPGLMPGTYVLQTQNGSLSGSYAGRTEITITDSNIEGAVLALGPAAEINGTVKLEGGDFHTLLKPPGSANSGAPSPAASAVGPRFTLTFAEVDGIGIGSPGAQVKDDGTFKVTGLGLNKYAINFRNLPQGAYVKTIQYGGQDVTHSLLDMSTAANGTLEVTLSDKAADVNGSVHNDKGEALPGVQVTLWPKIFDPGNTSSIRQANTDQNGGFKFVSLRPGEYFVAAWEELDTGLAQSPDFLKNLTGDASAIKLEEGGHESVDAKVVSRDKIVDEIAKIP